MGNVSNPDIEGVRLRLATMAEQIGVISRAIGSEREPANPLPSTPEKGTPLQMAEQLYADRRRRARHFRESLFCEPAWDILLDLFIAEARGRDISVTSACLAAGVPSTTGLRWLAILENEGLVTSEADSRDGRRRFIRLTPAAHARMRAYLGEEPKPPRLVAREAPGVFAHLV